MKTVMDQYFQQLSGGESQQKDNLQVIPLFLNQEIGLRNYLLLDEAMELGSLQISEASEHGMVNNLLVVNRGKQPVLILDGEELVGAKQNRMVNATILIPPEGSLDIPVSCVERGRWRYEGNNFQGSPVFGHSELRRTKASRVADNLSHASSFQADQHEVWEEIDRKQMMMDASSTTDAIHDVYTKYEGELEGFIAGLRPLENQTGIAVFINGAFNCLDMFGHHDVLNRLWKKLLTSYAMEALEMKNAKPKRAKAVNIEAVLTSLQEAELNQYPSVGLGTDIRLHNKSYMAAGLIFEEQVLHLAAFRNPEPSRENGGIAQPSRRRRVY